MCSVQTKNKEDPMNTIVVRLAEFALVMAGISFYAANVMNLLAKFDQARFLAHMS